MLARQHNQGIPTLNPMRANDQASHVQHRRHSKGHGGVYSTVDPGVRLPSPFAAPRTA